LTLSPVRGGGRGPLNPSKRPAVSLFRSIRIGIVID
jgi:hypothetical protein